MENHEESRRLNKTFLLQMAGSPGVGKSTLAAAIAQVRSAVVIDTDIVKSALLAANFSWNQAGMAAYAIRFELASDLLRQGYSVILDSPSHNPSIPQGGLLIAEKHLAIFKFIELICPDLDELQRRLTARSPLRSQMRQLDVPAPDSDGIIHAERIGPHRWRTFGPPEGYPVINTVESLEKCLQQALDYLDQ